MHLCVFVVDESNISDPANVRLHLIAGYERHSPQEKPHASKQREHEAKVLAARLTVPKTSVGCRERRQASYHATRRADLMMTG